MFVIFKNKNYNLAISSLSIKEIMKPQEIVPVPNNSKIAGIIRFRDFIVPISLIENHRPSNGIFLIIQNEEGLGGLWIDEVINVINSASTIQSLDFYDQQCDILDIEGQIYSLLNPKDIFSQEKSALI